jgi:hypothetical protein
VHVLGDGEYLFPPFLFAEYLERQGYDVFFQSTTRSPILMGHSIGAKAEFLDHYEDGIANFAYNLPEEGRGARVVLCHESPALGQGLPTSRAVDCVSWEEFLCA